MVRVLTPLPFKVQRQLRILIFDSSIITPGSNLLLGFASITVNESSSILKEIKTVMPRTVKCGLIQASHAGPTDAPIADIIKANVDKHVGLIEDAARQGVQILCMQEVFTTPYFCAEQQTRWYEAVEKIPDGPTTS